MPDTHAKPLPLLRLMAWCETRIEGGTLRDGHARTALNGSGIDLDETRFDQISKRVATGAARRRLLGGQVGVTAALLTAAALGAKPGGKGKGKGKGRCRGVRARRHGGNL